MKWYIVVTSETKELLKKYIGKTNRDTCFWDFNSDNGYKYYFENKIGIICKWSNAPLRPGYIELSPAQFVEYWTTGVFPSTIIESYPIY